MKFSHIATAAALSLTALASQAALVSAGTYTCSLTDVTPGATACSGAWAGNNANQEADVLAELAVLSPGTWSALGTTDAGVDNGPFNPFDDELNTGTLTLDGPISGTFAIALKGGNEFSLYVWENVMDVNAVVFTMGGQSALSHASLYQAEIIPGPIPEPSTYALMLAGLGAIGLVARRRRAQK
jgi:hypothetical protein